MSRYNRLTRPMGKVITNASAAKYALVQIVILRSFAVVRRSRSKLGERFLAYAGNKLRNLHECPTTEIDAPLRVESAILARNDKEKRLAMTGKEGQWQGSKLCR